VAIAAANYVIRPPSPRTLWQLASTATHDQRH